MTLLGFQVGAAGSSNQKTGGEPSTMDLSLDQMIANRRKEETKKTKAVGVPKKGSTIDQVVGRSRAKRNAAMAARRGLASSGKATAMEIEQQIKKQENKTAAAKLKKQKKGKQQRLPVDPKERAEERRKIREAKKTLTVGVNKGKKQSVTISSNPPPKRAVAAAVHAMEKTGYSIPQGMQMVISFAPAATDSSNKPKKKQQQQQQSARGRRNDGNGGRDSNKGGRGGGRGGGRR